MGDASAAVEICLAILPKTRTYGYAVIEARAQVALGDAYLALGKFAEAEAAFQEARHLAQGRFFQLSVEALAGLGIAAIRQGHYHTGEARLRQGLVEGWPAGLLPDVLAAVIGLAEIRAHTGDGFTARRWLQVAIAHPSTIYLARVHAQEVLLRLGQQETGADEIRDPQAVLQEIVTAIMASSDGVAEYAQD